MNHQLLKEKKDIINWLDKHKVSDYQLIEDQKYGYIVDVNNSVHLHSQKLKSIDVKFNEIHGDFNCFNNELTSLKGCPTIVNGDFSCATNYLTSLEYCPEIISNTLIISKNPYLKSILFLPIHVGKDILLSGMGFEVTKICMDFEEFKNLHHEHVKQNLEEKIIKKVGKPAQSKKPKIKI